MFLVEKISTGELQKAATAREAERLLLGKSSSAYRIYPMGAPFQVQNSDGKSIENQIKDHEIK